MDKPSLEELQSRETKELNLHVVQYGAKIFVIDKADGKVIRNVADEDLKCTLKFDGTSVLQVGLLAMDSQVEQYPLFEQNEQDGSQK